MSPLASATRRAIAAALLDAFDRESLEQLFYYRMDMTLDQVTGGGTTKTIIKDVLQRSELEGWTVKLVPPRARSVQTRRASPRRPRWSAWRSPRRRAPASNA